MIGGIEYWKREGHPVEGTLPADTDVIGQNPMTHEVMEQFAKAWSSRDVDAITAFFTTNCTYQASIGPELGRTYQGVEEVRRGICSMLAYNKGANSHVHNLHFCGDQGHWKWKYTFADGT